MLTAVYSNLDTAIWNLRTRHRFESSRSRGVVVNQETAVARNFDGERAESVGTLRAARMVLVPILRLSQGRGYVAPSRDY